MLGEAFIDERVIGPKQIEHAAILAQDTLEKQLSLLTKRLAHVQPMFILLQALVSQVFREADPGYGQECMAAARRCCGTTIPSTTG